MDRPVSAPSRHITDLLARIGDVERRMRPAVAVDMPEEKAFARLLDERERLTRLLAREPVFTEADQVAKVGVLHRRLLEELDIADHRAVTNVLLAASVPLPSAEKGQGE